MPFDKACSTYWCDKCGRMMDVDYEVSNEVGVVLKCTWKDSWTRKKPCDFRRFFIEMGPFGFEEETNAFDTLNSDTSVPVAVHDGGLAELDTGVLDRACDAPENVDEEVVQDDSEVSGGTHGSGGVVG